MFGALACWPLAVGLLALASGRVRGFVRKRPAPWALLVPACWLVRAFEVRALDPFSFLDVLGLSLVSVYALHRVARARAGLGPIDLVVLVGLFLPLDLRWFYAIWPGWPRATDGAYTFFALATAYLAALGWGATDRALPGLGHRPPTLRDAGIGLLALLGFGAIAIPVGLAAHFLKAPSLNNFEGKRAALEAVGLVLTVALPEEIFFRGVLDSSLEESLRRPALSLLLSSLAFGFMHWPRRDDLTQKLIYVGLATVAGVFYGLAFRRSKGLPAAVICHASVDWIWVVALN